VEAATSGAVSPLQKALEQPFTLGLFLPVLKGGWTISSAPRSMGWDFEYNRELTLRAEALGFDLVFALAQWLPKGGMGGAIKFREHSLDSFMSVAALAAVTNRIILISTLHVLYGIHPLFVARFGSTLDNVSKGRWGINLVTGARTEERPMFGLPPVEHDLRYEMLTEYTEILNRLWTRDENLDFKGDYWTLHGAYTSPRPTFNRPIFVNAGNSPPSLKLGARYCDFLFVTSPAGADIEPALGALPALNAQVRELVAAEGRNVRTIINPMIICRETEAEAKRQYNLILEGADEQATAAFMNQRDTKSWPQHTAKQRFVGGNVQLIGTPEQVVDWMVRLKKAGCGGVQVSFFDFGPDLEFFGKRVLPLMYQAGLRKPIVETPASGKAAAAPTAVH